MKNLFSSWIHLNGFKRAQTIDRKENNNIMNHNKPSELNSGNDLAQEMEMKSLSRISM